MMVQLPEPCNPNERSGKAALKLGLKTVADVAKERIKRAAKQLLHEVPDAVFDKGYRVLRFDRSCFHLWEGDTENFDEATLLSRIEAHGDHIDPKASAGDLLFELLLKDGFPLTVPMQRLDVTGKEVFSIAEGALLICLEKELTQGLMDSLAEMEPARVICLDAGFKGNDQLKANAVQTFKARARNKETAIEFRTV